MKKRYQILSNIVCAFLLITAITSCNKQDPFFETENISAEIVESKWVITRYDNTLTNQSFFPNDTLHFISSNEYTLNDGSLQTYTYVEHVGIAADARVLTIENCASFGGTYWASFESNFLAEDQIGNLLFNGYNDNDIVVWLERVN